MHITNYPLFAYSPWYFARAASNTALPASNVWCVPRYTCLPFTLIKALYALRFLVQVKPFTPVVLCEGFRLFLLLPVWFVSLKLPGLLSVASPFMWSIIDPLGTCNPVNTRDAYGARARNHLPFYSDVSNPWACFKTAFGECVSQWSGLFVVVVQLNSFDWCHVIPRLICWVRSKTLPGCYNSDLLVAIFSLSFKVYHCARVVHVERTIYTQNKPVKLIIYNVFASKKW